MAKLKTLSSIFTTITKEELQERIECDFTILKSKMEEKKALKVDVMKHLVGRPPRASKALLLTQERLEVLIPIVLDLLFGF
jgi:hypothetical protein